MVKCMGEQNCAPHTLQEMRKERDPIAEEEQKQYLSMTFLLQTSAESMDDGICPFPAINPTPFSLPKHAQGECVHTPTHSKGRVSALPCYKPHPLPRERCAHTNSHCGESKGSMEEGVCPFPAINPTCYKPIPLPRDSHCLVRAREAWRMVSLTND